MPVKAVAEKATKAAGEQEPPPKSRKKLFLILLVVLAAGLAAAFFLLKPAPKEAPAPKPGEVVALDPIQVNLAGGHYLKIGIALQLTSGAKEAEGSKALDATIDLFSGKSMASLALPEQREKLKDKLSEELSEKYEGEVMGVYFTEFVTQ